MLFNDLMKILAVFFTVVLFVLFFSEPSAQVLNSGFEKELAQGGGIKNWSSITLFHFPDDSLHIDSALYFRNSDPHSGEHALELRNGYSADVKYSGHVSLSEDDSDYGSFATGMAFTELPKYFTFYYKFFPAGPNDTARATISLINGVDGDIQGSAEILISKLNPEYTEAIVPITYTGSGAPTNLFIDFATRTQNSVPNFGTRFLIDDVGLRNTVSSVRNRSEGGFHVSCSPNPATNSILFQTNKTTTDKLTISIFTLNGERIGQYSFTNSLSLNDFNFAKGTYLYTITSEHNSTVSGKFIVK